MLSYLQIQSAHPFLRHGRYSEALLKSDVGTLESLYRSNGFHKVQIQTTVDDNYRGWPNKLAVHIHIDEGVRTRVGEAHIVGNEKLKSEDLPELSTQAGQPYSEQDLSSDRERVLSYYFDHGFRMPRWKSPPGPLPPNRITKMSLSLFRKDSASR